MGRYVKNLRAFRGNAKFLSGSHEFRGSLEITSDGESIALFRDGSSNIESIAYFKDSNMGVGTSSPTSKLTVNGDADISGSLYLSASAYLNWASVTGSDGYGLRDNSGTIEFKSSGSTWAPIGSGGGSGKLIRNRNAIVTHYTVTSNDSIIGVNATASITISLPDPSTLTDGQCFLIKDEAGNAGTYNIVINTRAGTADRIDGTTSLTMAVDDSAVNLYTDGSSKYFIY